MAENESQEFDPNASLAIRIKDGVPVVIGPAKEAGSLTGMPSAETIKPLPEPPPFKQPDESDLTGELPTPNVDTNATQVSQPTSEVPLPKPPTE